MSGKRVAIGADHGGYEDKKKIAQFLKSKGYQVIDVGTTSAEAADYPVYGFRVAEAVGRGHADIGVLLCRSGNGMSMAANKVPGVRAAIAGTTKLASLAREHNDANVLVVGSDYIEEPVEKVLDAFLAAKPEDGRHERRVNMIKKYDQTQHSSLATYQLIAHGQSPWLDDISDMLIRSGELKRMVEHEGLRGLTSNPTIFEKAINGGEGRYRQELHQMKQKGATVEEAYETFTSEDIGAAADILRPVYDETGGDDGFVSLELPPSLSYDEEGSVKEAIRLFKLLNRPNVMIKVPGTTEGIRAFRRLTAEGVNINVTLIFSRVFYNDIARAYIDGLRDRLKKGGDITRIRSVASVFVSRIDSAVDKRLEELKSKEHSAGGTEIIDQLVHQIAIANTKLIYRDFKKIFHGGEFDDLAEKAAAVQRPLWGSTSTKNPNLRDTLYVEELVGPETVNTIPLPTFKALIDHGRIRGNTLEEDVATAEAKIEQLRSLGIEIEDVCMELQKAGVKSFADSFDQLIDAVKKALV